ncbi:MAG: hypothetical protein ACI9U0_000019 [Flavobacteriales bacterium]
MVAQLQKGIFYRRYFGRFNCRRDAYSSRNGLSNDCRFSTILWIICSNESLGCLLHFWNVKAISVGPVALDSLLVAAGVSGIAALGSESYILLAVLLSFIMGLVQVAFGIFRLGFLVNFLSKPVISGFTSAAALIIGLNQLKHIIGVDLNRSTNIFSIIYQAVLSYEIIN